ncbi:MAG: lipoyl(octanoyl) transferase LipB [Kofleriaceae bacterium]|nr:lipoyl(octanoyl) transferase LipB [Kofleriaceae bacterium]
MTRALTAYRVGRIRYADALRLQEQLREARAADRIGDVLLLLEHDPVITLGRGAKSDQMLHAPEELARLGFDVHETGRGGGATYHGPGQVVGYPIVNLSPDREDVRRYVRDLEHTMIAVCADFGIVAERIDEKGLEGVWVGRNKIGAIGVRLANWITMHGFALNVTTRLGDFGVIVPCGIRGRGVTSMEVELETPPTQADVELRLAVRLAEHLDRELVWREGAPDVS